MSHGDYSSEPTGPKECLAQTTDLIGKGFRVVWNTDYDDGDQEGF
jgi:hypothetical protein